MQQQLDESPRSAASLSRPLAAAAVLLMRRCAPRARWSSRPAQLTFRRSARNGAVPHPHAPLCATGSVTQRPPRQRVTNCSGMGLSMGSASSAPGLEAQTAVRKVWQCSMFTNYPTQLQQHAHPLNRCGRQADAKQDCKAYRSVGLQLGSSRNPGTSAHATAGDMPT